MKKILVILNYYYPYVSGVSEYARLMAEEFVNRGCEVTVVTSNHANLASEEVINGVKVIRTNVWFKISKGTISPQFIFKAIKYSKKNEVVAMNLPMLESGLISLFIPKNKQVVTYHCDINLPKSFLNNCIVSIMDCSHKICLHRCRNIIVHTKDYAKTSRVAYKYLDKCVEIPPKLKQYYPVSQSLQNKKRIGFCGRIVEEKGIDVLLRAFALISQKREDVELVIGGDYKNIAGGSIYPDLTKYIEDNNIKNVVFLGKIPEEKMADFYSSLDVLTLPSVNSLEAFGVVQIEAMFCGTPVVASNLPGVRTIVQNTGMGEIAKVGDYIDLAKKIEKVIDNKKKYQKDRKEIEEIYGIDAVYKSHYNVYFKEK